MRFAVATVLALAATVSAHWSQGSSASGSTIPASASAISASVSAIPASASASAPTIPASASQNTAISAGQPSGSAAGSPAQPSGTTGIAPCVLNCLAAAANATECGVPTNLTCACTNPDFQFKSRSCLQAECKPDDLVAALGLQQQQCAPLSLSATASPSATAPFTPSNAGADISAAPTGSSAGSSGSPSSTPGSALSLFAPNGGKGLVFAVGVAVVGGLVGAVVV
ncbi:hypothetical protein DFH08DRAFT_945516 [Mycena albidolilacea]|uniref:CFEM domain-containing protein n=1 Tax=Mycena albidolilacea TaxID=1033008 RepID=A0AAD6Z0U2_9AGAR|nr:hypothetical protein DFH08DRAFT_945516 [Mycena albidolilacea]